MTVEVKIGVQYAAREIVVESSQTPEAVEELITAAVKGRWPVDARGRARPPGLNPGREARLRRDRRSERAQGRLRHRDVARRPEAEK